MIVITHILLHPPLISPIWLEVLRVLQRIPLPIFFSSFKSLSDMLRGIRAESSSSSGSSGSVDDSSSVKSRSGVYAFSSGNSSLRASSPIQDLFHCEEAHRVYGATSSSQGEGGLVPELKFVPELDLGSLRLPFPGVQRTPRRGRGRGSAQTPRWGRGEGVVRTTRPVNVIEPTRSDGKSIQELYCCGYLPNIDIVIPALGQRPWNPPLGYIALYEAFFTEYGLWFLLPRLLVAFCEG